VASDHTTLRTSQYIALHAACHYISISPILQNNTCLKITARSWRACLAAFRLVLPHLPFSDTIRQPCCDCMAIRQSHDRLRASCGGLRNIAVRVVQSKRLVSDRQFFKRAESDIPGCGRVARPKVRRLVANRKVLDPPRRFERHRDTLESALNIGHSRMLSNCMGGERHVNQKANA
jgi:hypothetical protein